MARRGKTAQARPFVMVLIKPNGQRLPARRYETEMGARIGAARLLGEFYDGRQRFPNPVAQITGPGVSITLTKNEALYASETGG